MATARKTSAAPAQAPAAATQPSAAPQDPTAQDEVPATGRYIVLDALHHDGQAYAMFDQVELTVAQAAALPAGVIAPAETDTTAEKD